MIMWPKAVAAAVLSFALVASSSKQSVANDTGAFLGGLAVAAIAGAAIVGAASAARERQAERQAPTRRVGKKVVVRKTKPAPKKVASSKSSSKCWTEALPVLNTAGKQVAIQQVRKCG